MLNASIVAPSRGRGLKLGGSYGNRSPASRPFTGAWIETPKKQLTRLSLSVAPSRGRGLKLIWGALIRGG